eukprot:8910034-Alexandrium_andersonii.AAC.1
MGVEQVWPSMDCRDLGSRLGATHDIDVSNASAQFTSSLVHAQLRSWYSMGTGGQGARMWHAA